MNFIHSYLQYIQDNPLPVGITALALYAVFRMMSFLTGSIKFVLGVLGSMLLFWLAA